MKYVYVKNIVVYNCFASTQWRMETCQLFPGQNQALVCLIQPKTGNYVYEYENMNFMCNIEVRQKVNESLLSFVVKGLTDPVKKLEIALVSKS